MSLGWLSESSILPKKQKTIEGISANTMVELKALIYDKQSQNKSKSSNLVERKTLGAKNKGVEERIQRDKAIMRQETEKDTQKNLQKKALLYEQMLRGELDQNEEQLVDFIRKEEFEQIPKESNLLIHSNELYSKDMQNEDQRKIWEKNIRHEEKNQTLKLKKASNSLNLSTSTATAREKVKQIRLEKKKKQKKRIMKIKMRTKTKTNNGSDSD
jgi:hypothetical protein